MTPAKIIEDRLKLAAQRVGLRIIADRYAKDATGEPKYLLRPYWNAKRAVRARPDGGYEMAPVWKRSRRRTASQFSLEQIEAILADWDHPIVCAPTLLPWRATHSAPAVAAQHQR
jgi:hypothetical protein